MRCVTVASPPSPTPLEMARLRHKLCRLVCSAPWFDRCWAEFDANRLKDRKRVDHALDRAEIYPPGGTPRRGVHRTLMRRCKLCTHRWHPPQYVRSCGICEDCIAARQAPLTDEKTHVRSTESPTSETLRLLEHYQIRLVETRLPAEDEASLKNQIAAFLNNPCQRNASLRPLENTKKHKSV